MDENMELEVKRRLAQYRKCKCLGIAVWIIVAFHFLYLLFKIDSRITWLIGGYGYFILGFGLLLLTLILFVICEMIIMVGTSKISSALSMDCDPFLYEACILKSGGFCIRTGSYAIRRWPSTTRGSSNLHGRRSRGWKYIS